MNMQNVMPKFQDKFSHVCLNQLWSHCTSKLRLYLKCHAMPCYYISWLIGRLRLAILEAIPWCSISAPPHLRILSCGQDDGRRLTSIMLCSTCLAKIWGGQCALDGEQAVRVVKLNPRLEYVNVAREGWVKGMGYDELPKRFLKLSQ